MKKIINAILLAVLLFILLNFLYSNMSPETLGYPMVFRFKVPGLFTLRSVDMPLGFVLIIAFSAGLVFLAFVQAIPMIFRNKLSKRQQKKIKELERELSNLPALPSNSKALTSSLGKSKDSKELTVKK